MAEWAELPVITSYPVWYTPSRHTRTNNLRVLQGRHPFGLELGPEGTTCGTCVHKGPAQYEDASRYLKCALAKQTRGAATDLRAKWPGCERWQESRAAKLERLGITEADLHQQWEGSPGEPV